MSFTELPTEIVANILPTLDLISIYNLSLTNRIIYARIQAHNIYHYLTSNQTTRETLKILSQTTLFPNHSLIALIDTLHNPNCSCCNRRAPYIHLPTATRACLTCLHHCASLQLIPIDLASSTFGIPVNAFMGISLRTVPGIYSTDVGMQDHYRPSLLVNAVQARDLAANLLGAAALDTFMAKRNVDVASYIMPLDSTGYFVTPYTDVDFEMCQVRIEVEDLVQGSSVSTRSNVKEEWKGIVGMGCEPWPVLDKESGIFELDMDELVQYRIINGYRLAKRDGLFRSTWSTDQGSSQDAGYFGLAHESSSDIVRQATPGWSVSQH